MNNNIIKLVSDKKFFPRYYLEDKKIYKILDIKDDSYYIKNIIVKLKKNQCIEYVKIDGKHPNAYENHIFCLEERLYEIPFDEYLRSLIIKLVMTINGNKALFLSFRNYLILKEL